MKTFIAIVLTCFFLSLLSPSGVLYLVTGGRLGDHENEITKKLADKFKELGEKSPRVVRWFFEVATGIITIIFILVSSIPLLLAYLLSPGAWYNIDWKPETPLTFSLKTFKGAGLLQIVFAIIMIPYYHLVLRVGDLEIGSKEPWGVFNVLKGVFFRIVALPFWIMGSDKFNPDGGERVEVGVLFDGGSDMGEEIALGDPPAHSTRTPEAPSEQV